MESRLRARIRPYALAWRRFRRGQLGLTDLAYGRSTSFSQFGEDVILAQLFEDRATGVYVDVGAYDPFDASNTYLLYRRGWSGINIEPNPLGHSRLVRSRPRDVNLNCAVTSSDGPVRVSVAGSFSAITDEQAAVETVVVPGRPLRSILEEHLTPGASIDLLDVDCEGHDLTVLESNDWEAYRPRVVLAEWHDDAETAVPEFLGALGYELLLRLRLTGLFVAGA